MVLEPIIRSLQTLHYTFDASSLYILGVLGNGGSDLGATHVILVVFAKVFIRLKN